MNTIPIGMIGLSHKTASVELREKLSLKTNSPGDERILLSQQLINKFKINGVLCLATCNRTEIYVSGIKYAGDLIRIQNFLISYKEAQDLDFQDSFYQHYGLDAVAHFNQVISGLDSQIIGENQITSQIKDCARLAKKYDFIDTLLEKMYSLGLQANKKIRSETHLGDGAVSISFAGVELARKIFEDLTDKKVLLIGAGETAELAAENFIEKNIDEIHVVNRTFSRAQELAYKFNAKAHDMSDLVSCLKDVDIVISATSSDRYVVNKEMMIEVMKARRNSHSIFLIDLAMPRDIESSVDDLSGVFLYNLDDLSEVVELNLEKRKKEIPIVMDLVNDFAQQFRVWKFGYSMSSLISNLKDYFDDIRVSEIERLKNRLPKNSMKDIDYLTESIINKILHQHIKTLKKSAVDPDLYREYADMLIDLYGLNK